MATPTYFQNFPNIDYATKLDKAGNTTNINIKDYFRLLRLRDDVFRQDTLYYEYVVKNGETPDQVSFKNYEDAQYYWVILQVNGITDFYNQWPLSSYELEQYINRKYGVEGAQGIHHYETEEVKDSKDRIIQHAGLWVTADYVFRYVDSNDPTVELTSTPDPVTNYKFELDLNTAKARIQILDPKYILDYAREYELWAQNETPQKSEVDISEATSY